MPTRPKRSSLLRSRLRELLALSLATPLAAAGACHGANGAVSDGATTPATTPDAAREASTSADDAGLDACAPVRVDPGFFGEDGSCGRFVYLPCGVPPSQPGSGCVANTDLCSDVCPSSAFFDCQYPAPTCDDGSVAPDAAIYIDCATCLGDIGRRPAGYVKPARRRARTAGEGALVGEYFAYAAHLERTSVDAFVELHGRLVAFGAPGRLRRAALAAADDERRHARVTTRLARRFGGELPIRRRSPFATLTFEQLALENAVEGCVRETFGAVIAMHQGARAADRKIARALARIAEDETRHAELAWSVHRWVSARLSREAKRRVRQAQIAALEEMRRGVTDPPPAVGRVAGLPRAEVQVRVLDAFARALFGAPGRPG